MKRIVAIVIAALMPTAPAWGQDRSSQPSAPVPSPDCPTDGSLIVKSPLPKPIDDPFPSRIVFGEIAVRAEEFVQLPKTEDVGVAPGRFNAAHARVQGLVPVPDGSGRLAIIDQRGKVYLVDAEGDNLSLYLDLIKAHVGYYAAKLPLEMGLMGIAFHPDFARRHQPGYGKFYTAYSASSISGVADYHEYAARNHESVVREWTAANPQSNAFEGTTREILRVGQVHKVHNIGRIAFNPTTVNRENPDYGMLYIGMGDGGGGQPWQRRSQSLLSPLGSLLRIDPLGGDDGRAYGIPHDNPFVGRDDALPEIYTYGNRHPQHLSWDHDGRLFFIEIGESMVEEVNVGVAGGNYGWPMREGSFVTGFAYQGGQQGAVYPLPPCDDVHGFIYPVAEYDHDESRAIGGGYVYRGDNIASLRGKYVFTDLMEGRLFYIDADTAEPGRRQTIYELRVDYDGKGGTLLQVAGMHDNRGRRVDLRLGRDAEGELYLLTKGDGKVRRLVAAAE